MPASLMSTSTRPNSSMALCTASAHWSSWVTSRVLGQGRVPDFAGQALGFLVMDVAEQDPGAFLCEQSSFGLSHSPSGSADQGDFSVQSFHVGLQILNLSSVGGKW